MLEQNNPLPQNKDRHLDVPSEASRDKYVNFRDPERETENAGGGQTGEDKNDSASGAKAWRRASRPVTTKMLHSIAG